MRIDALSLKKFRGASAPVRLQFEKDKALVLVFGENGTGKSTIVDALDFVCNDEYGSLTHKSSTQPKRHLPSLGSAASDLEVAIEAGGETWTGRLEAAGPHTVGPAKRPRLAVLRRSQILRIINEQPKKRYEALGDLLGLPGIRRSEENLRNALGERQGRYDEAVRAKQQADEALEKLWQAEGKPGTSALDWARGRAADDPAVLKASLAESNRILPLFDRVSAASGDVSSSRGRLEHAEQLQLTAQRELEAAEQATDAGPAGLVDLLTDAQRVLAGRDPAECPLCESAERIGGLASRVAGRLSDLTRLVDLRRQARDAQTTLDRASGAFESAASAFAAVTRELGVEVKSATRLQGLFQGLDWSEYTVLLAPTGKPADAGARAEADRIWARLKDRQPQLMASRDEQQTTLNQLSAVQQHVSTVDEKDAAAKDLETTTKSLKELLSVVESHRKTYVDQLLTAVSAKAQSMYAKIHPGEGLGDVRFFLKASVMGSLECDGSFQGTSGVPPQAYYSDSHLDTLGICVFLALAQAADNAASIVALDDVLTSADSPHADRLMAMLQEEKANFKQILVTTHYRPWRERFRFRGSDHVQLLDLGNWSLSRGIWPVKTKLKIDELRDLLLASPLDSPGVASKAGVFLEELLRFICLRYRCKVPLLLEPNHALGDLASAITSKLSRLLRGEKLDGASGQVSATVDLGPLIEDATRWGWVRNQVGAHFSIAGLGVPDADVREFAEACLRLVDCLVCETCGEAPGRNRSGSYWECQCKGLRLHPLAMPGDSTPAIEA